MARYALLIGVSEFVDKRLSRLNAPRNDVAALSSILEDNALGYFDKVELSQDEDFLEIRDRLSRFFHDRSPDDLLLLYYSGHGILGRGNRLFLATTSSNLDLPRDRSISASEIREFVAECRAGKEIVILDCCHSGAFTEHAKAADHPPALTSETFAGAGAGLYVLTAADALQFAWDGQELRVGEQSTNRFSLFTSWLVEGLKTGAAAPDEDEITMDALYRYLSHRARTARTASTPQRFIQDGVGDLIISHSVGVGRLDPEIDKGLADNNYWARSGAVRELAEMLSASDTRLARAAGRRLQRHLDIERDYRVRQIIEETLQRLKQPRDTMQPQEPQILRQGLEPPKQPENNTEPVRAPATLASHELESKQPEHNIEPFRSPDEPAIANQLRNLFSWTLKKPTRIGLGIAGIVTMLLPLLVTFDSYPLNNAVPKIVIFVCISIILLTILPTFLFDKNWISYLAIGINMLMAAFLAAGYASDLSQGLDSLRNEAMGMGVMAIAFIVEALTAALNVLSRRHSVKGDSLLSSLPQGSGN